MRDAELPSRSGRFKKRMPAAERQRESGGRRAFAPVCSPYNRPDTGVCPARKGADVSRVSR